MSQLVSTSHERFSKHTTLSGFLKTGNLQCRPYNNNIINHGYRLTVAKTNRRKHSRFNFKTSTDTVQIT